MNNQAQQNQNDDVITDEFLDSLYEKGPEITEEQMIKIEVNIGGKSAGMRRRLALAVLTKSIKELCEVGEKDPSIHAEMREQVEAAFEDAKATLELAQAAHMRMQIVDCHIQAVLESAA